MKKWLAYWCNEGLEHIREITQYEHWEQQQTFDILSDRRPQPNPLHGLINAMTMRARFNTQRAYELYVFNSTDDLVLTDLLDWSKDHPQSFVDWIRANGVKLHSDHESDRRRTIV